LFWALANQRWVVGNFSNSCRLLIGKPFCLFQNISQHSYLFFPLSFKKRNGSQIGDSIPNSFFVCSLDVQMCYMGWPLICSVLSLKKEKLELYTSTCPTSYASPSISYLQWRFK
jgi:hypothetical protein